MEWLPEDALPVLTRTDPRWRLIRGAGAQAGDSPAFPVQVALPSGCGSTVPAVFPTADPWLLERGGAMRRQGPPRVARTPLRTWLSGEDLHRALARRDPGGLRNGDRSQTTRAPEAATLGNDGDTRGSHAPGAGSGERLEKHGSTTAETRFSTVRSVESPVRSGLPSVVISPSLLLSRHRSGNERRMT